MGARIAVLVSGSGTNLQALLDDHAIASHIAVVLSDRPGVAALDRASGRDVEAIVVEPSAYPDRGIYTNAVRDVLVERSVDTVVLAGFMRVLGASFFEAFPDRVLNVHPALLPSFPGAHAVADALAWGVKVTGVTVHVVDDQVDHGPIVLQETVEVRDGDTWETLEPRVHAVEHRLLPAAVRALLDGRVVVEGRKVRIIEGERSP
ncbi:MAG: phosphoribosylglycinamide formyltransferase [Actinomycetota bacterium]